jgi:hypothetical protein
MSDDLDDYLEARYLARVVEGNVINRLARRALLSNGEMEVTPDEYWYLKDLFIQRPRDWDIALAHVILTEGIDPPAVITIKGMPEAPTVNLTVVYP